jgi:uncharacterized membrane protein
MAGTMSFDASPASSHPQPRASAFGSLESFLVEYHRAVLAAMIGAHILLFAAIGFVKYRYFLFTDFDLAIFAQACDGLLHGSMFSSIRGMNWLGDHSSLILFLVAPIYAIFRHPLTLVVVQAAALALGAIPVSRMARRASGSATFAATFAALYLAYPALGYLDLFEFHPEALAVAPLLFMLDAWQRGRLRSMTLWALLAALAREDVALVLGGVAVYALLVRRRLGLRESGVLIAIALASLALSFLVLKPMLSSGEANYGHMYAQWGTSVADIARQFATHPWRALAALVWTPGDSADGMLKRMYFAYLLLPLAALPLLDPLMLIPAAPIVFEHMLSSRPAQHSIDCQYSALVIPFVIAAAIAGGARLLGTGTSSPGEPPPRGRRSAMVAGAALACCLASHLWFGPLIGVIKTWSIERPEDIWPDGEARTLAPFRDAMLARTPKGLGIVSGLELISHLTARDDVHSIHHFIGGTYTYSDKPYPVPHGVGALAADLADGELFEHVNAGTSARWRELRSANHLAPVASAGDNVLFLRGAADSVELCAPTHAAPRFARRVVYDGQLQFLGSDSLAAGDIGGVIAISTYWRRTASLRSFFLTEIVLVDPAHQDACQVLRHLGYTFYPPPDWALEQTVRENYNMIVPLDLSPGIYELRMRPWADGADPTVSPADDPLVRANDNWVTLGKLELRKKPR